MTTQQTTWLTHRMRLLFAMLGIAAIVWGVFLMPGGAFIFSRPYAEPTPGGQTYAPQEILPVGSHIPDDIWALGSGGEVVDRETVSCLLHTRADDSDSDYPLGPDREHHPMVEGDQPARYITTTQDREATLGTSLSCDGPGVEAFVLSRSVDAAMMRNLAIGSWIASPLLIFLGIRLRKSGYTFEEVRRTAPS